MRGTQRARIFDLLKSRQGQWVPLPEILSLGFAQFGSRIFELRRDGHKIENKTEYKNDKVLSWYKLVAEQDFGAQGVVNEDRRSTLAPETLIDITQDRSYAE